MVTRVRLIAALILVAVGTADAAVPCESITSQSLHGAIVLSARVEPGGRFLPPLLPTGSAQPIDNLPSFCRVTASLKPTTDSDVRIEVWLPTTTWNGKLQSVGNSAWAA
jgi:feruloyl esterase